MDLKLTYDREHSGCSLSSVNVEGYRGSICLKSDLLLIILPQKTFAVCRDANVSE